MTLFSCHLNCKALITIIAKHATPPIMDPHAQTHAVLTVETSPDNGDCYDCLEGLFGRKCNETCGSGCVSGCDQITGHCTCKQGWEENKCVGKQYYFVFSFFYI